MKSTLQKRLSRLESQHGAHQGPLMIVLVDGGPTGEQRDDATLLGYESNDGELFTRQPGETIDALEARIIEGLTAPKIFSEIRSDDPTFPA